MIQLSEIALETLHVGATQTVVAPVSPELTAIAFLAGPQFFIALIAGVLMAFAFQFLLTNFTLAADVSAGIDPTEGEAKSWGRKVRGMESKVGGWMLLTVNIAVFTACFLAVKLTLVHSLQLGAILGVVIWSAYFLLLLWAGSRTVGSVFSAVGSTASSGLQGILGTVATALSGSAVNAQIVNTVEASVEAVTKELKSELASGLAPDRLRENVADYVQQLKVPSPDLGGMTSQISEILGNLSQQTGSLNVSDVATGAVKAATPDGLTSGLVNVAKAAAPEDLKAGKLQDLVEQLLQSMRSQQPTGQSTGQSSGQSSGQQSGNGSGNGLRQEVLTQGINALISAVAQRVDLSDVDVEQIGNQLSSLQQRASEQASHAVDSVQQQASQRAGQVKDAFRSMGSFSLLQTDIENYLLSSPSWYLRSESLDSGFRMVLRDPDADAGLVRRQLEPLNRRYFVSVLQRREGLEESRINDIADQLELIRREVLDQVREAEEESNRQDLRQRVELFLSTVPKEMLTGDRLPDEFAALLADPEVSYETLGNRLIQFDRTTLRQMVLSGRQDLNEDEIEPILNALEQSRDRFLNQSQEQWNQMQRQASDLRGRVESYLQEASAGDLTNGQLQRNLERLANLPETGQVLVRAGLGQIDREQLEPMLAQRQDLSEEQVHQVIDRFETIRDRLLHAPENVADQIQEQSNRLVSQVADYLRNTELEELDPDAIQQELVALLRSPKMGSIALRRRFAQMDRETLTRLLSQQGVSEQRVNKAIDQVQAAARAAVRAPRRLASRASEQVQDVQSTLADYLKHTDRQELNPEGIQRDLKLLLQQPRMGLEQWRDRFSQIDRGTLVALLSQREDLSEEDVNRIIDQVIGQLEEVRHQVAHQFQGAKEQVQETTQATLNQIFGSIRSYFDDLERPELNYDAIKRDMRTLFEDPEAGIESLSYRLRQFDRDTLAAILSTRTDLSEEQANRIIDQIEAARDSALHQATRLQEEVEKRISAVKHEAQKQADEVRKSVATAAWWLFGTAITSVATAAIAGIIAAGGMDLFT